MTAPRARLKVTRSLTSNSAFGRQIEQLSARRIARALDSIGDDAVRRCDQIVSAELVNDRIPERRKPGRHLLGSFRYEVIWDGRSLPVSLKLYSLADPGKVNALERGADPHTITASNALWLTFPRTARSTWTGALGDIKFSGIGPTQRQQGYRGSGKSMTKIKSVEHPGNLPYSFMERALNAAMRDRLRSALAR